MSNIESKSKDKDIAMALAEHASDGVRKQNSPVASNREASPGHKQDTGMTSSSMQHSVKHFRFMDLPAELRIIIYKEAFVHASDIDLAAAVHDRTWTANGSWDFNRRCNSHSEFLPKLLVSKSFYQEAAPIYYHFNRFKIKAGHLLRLQYLPPLHRRNITSLSLVIEGWRSLAGGFKFLRTFVGLKHLELDCRPGLYPFCCSEWGAREVHIGCFAPLWPLKKVRGLEILKIDVYCRDCGERVPHHLLSDIETALSCTKLAHSPAYLTRLDRKDFPEKFSRSNFGTANVSTRKEHQVLGTKPWKGLD